MTFRAGLVALSVLLLLISGCAAPAAPAPVAEPAAPAAPVEEAAAAEQAPPDRWDEILRRGVLTVGVSAGDSPYAFYRPDLTLDGFDVALAIEIGRRLHLELMIRDLPPDSLLDALRAGQIDLAIGGQDAASDTAPWAERIGPYYVARDAVLMRSGAGPLRSAAELSNLRLGVLEGGSYHDWAKAVLVATGQMDAARLIAYQSVLEAADALAGGEVDALMLDYRPALRLAQERGLVVAGEGLASRQEIMIAPAGSQAVLDEVKGALDAAVSDGAVARLAGRYFGLAQQDILPLPLSSAPTATPRPPDYFSADRSRLAPGECATISWHVESVQGVFFCECGEPWEKHPATGQETRRVCPPQTTTYELHVVHYGGREEARSVTVTVGEAAELPAAVYFEAQPVQAKPGSCIELRWEAPEDAGWIRLTRNGETLWDGAPPAGATSDCPPGSGVFVYLLEQASGGGAVRVERAVEVR